MLRNNTTKQRVSSELNGQGCTKPQWDKHAEGRIQRERATTALTAQTSETGSDECTR